MIQTSITEQSRSIYPPTGTLIMLVCMCKWVTFMMINIWNVAIVTATGPQDRVVERA